MKDDQHEVPEAPRALPHENPRASAVGARVDRAQHARAKANPALPSARLTSDWSEYRSDLLRLFFHDAAPLATRYRVSGEDLASHAFALAQPRIARGSMLKPVVCVADLAVATACCLGRANAWNELWIFAEPSMTRAAFGRLPETLALTWTRRYWTQLERVSREGQGGLMKYDGSRPIKLWIVEELIGALEAERAAGRLEIRREHIGRPIPLRLVGEQLA